MGNQAASKPHDPRDIDHRPKPDQLMWTQPSDSSACALNARRDASRDLSSAPRLGLPLLGGYSSSLAAGIKSHLGDGDRVADASQPREPLW